MGMVEEELGRRKSLEIDESLLDDCNQSSWERERERALDTLLGAEQMCVRND